MTICHICQSPDLQPLAQRGRPFRLVSSDVRPVDGAAAFTLCRNCLAVQKSVTPAWREMASQIYEGYDINHQSQGVEPTIFDSSKGTGPRSLILLRYFLENADLPPEGRLLDIGCSNGNLLRSFHEFRPNWRLSGTELVDRWRATVMALPGVEAFYSGPEYSGPEPSFDGQYEISSLSHVLEHVADPSSFLRAVARHLKPGGRILIASPNLRQNPIDLVIADHCTHFEEASLSFVIRQAGLSVDRIATTMLPKELVAIATTEGSATQSSFDGTSYGLPQAMARGTFYFELLEDVRRTAEVCRRGNRPYGVMGSSIAACWITLELGGGVSFFVDEDASRVGHRLIDLPIVAPSEVPAGAVVFIPMSAHVAGKIIERWKHLPIDFRFSSANRPL